VDQYEQVVSRLVLIVEPLGAPDRARLRSGDQYEQPGSALVLIHDPR